jgi:hypothetical protein
MATEAEKSAIEEYLKDAFVEILKKYEGLPNTRKTREAVQEAIAKSLRQTVGAMRVERHGMTEVWSRKRCEDFARALVAERFNPPPEEKTGASTSAAEIMRGQDAAIDWLSKGGQGEGGVS